MASTSAQIIFKFEPNSYFHVITNTSFIESSMYLFHVDYVQKINTLNFLGKKAQSDVEGYFAQVFV